MPLRILIADDHAVLRAGLRALLSRDSRFEIVGDATSGDEAIRAATELEPDLVVMDLSMPGTGGIDATRRLKERLPGIRVLILTLHEDAALLHEAVRIGASGYIVKRAVESELIAAIDAAERGEFYVHSSMTRALLAPPREAPSARREPDPLTNRELDVVRCLVRGYTNRQDRE